MREGRGDRRQGIEESREGPTKGGGGKLREEGGRKDGIVRKGGGEARGKA